MNKPVIFMSQDSASGISGTQGLVRIGDKVFDGLISAPIVVNKEINALYTNKKWVFPYDRFIEYGPEDEWWARKYGFGKEVDYTKPIAYDFKGTIHCNEKFLEEIEKWIKR